MYLGLEREMVQQNSDNTGYLYRTFSECSKYFICMMSKRGTTNPIAPKPTGQPLPLLPTVQVIGRERESGQHNSSKSLCEEKGHALPRWPQGEALSIAGVRRPLEVQRPVRLHWLHWVNTVSAQGCYWALWNFQDGLWTITVLHKIQLFSVG